MVSSNLPIREFPKSGQDLTSQGWDFLRSIMEPILGRGSARPGRLSARSRFPVVHAPDAVAIIIRDYHLVTARGFRGIKRTVGAVDGRKRGQPAILSAGDTEARCNLSIKVDVAARPVRSSAIEQYVKTEASASKGLRRMPRTPRRQSAQQRHAGQQNVAFPEPMRG